MKKRSTKIIRTLQIIHLAIFVTVVTTITLLHIFTENFLDILRFPPYVKAVDPFAAYNWPGGFHFYHVVLAFALIITLTNALGLYYYRSKIWRVISDISSFLGFLILWPTALFFIFTLATVENLNTVNINRALIFFAFGFGVFILDLITWFVDEQSLLKVFKK